MSCGRTCLVGVTGSLQLLDGLVTVCLSQAMWCMLWSFIVLVAIVERNGVPYGVQ